MNNTIKGKILILDDNIDTDQICPGRFLELTDPKEIGKICLSGISESISKNFEQGTIIVAGKNFGCGSSREHAAIALLNMGASAVVAESFARIFYRNGINLGLPLITCKDIKKYVTENSILEINLSEGDLYISDFKKNLPCDAFNSKIIEILNAGGIKNLMKKKILTISF